MPPDSQQDAGVTLFQTASWRLDEGTDIPFAGYPRRRKRRRNNRMGGKIRRLFIPVKSVFNQNGRRRLRTENDHYGLLLMRLSEK